MADANWEKVKEVFALAVEQPTESRRRFLEEICVGDSTLFNEVASLLEAHDEPENLVEKNRINLSAQIIGGKNKNLDGRVFGNYRIIKEIGCGGMGAVFLAERADSEFSQNAALKIVRQSFLDAELENYFRRERQILAALNHPNIARLLDGGVSENGESYLVMEFVSGETLLEFAASHRLSIEERLELFQKICAAVAFAHRNLIVHRDLKPSNILVAENGEPKLLDFGLAKILGDNLSDQTQTQTALRAFTPAYASPEQIQGKKITTASDVFSLGVVLYELLTGARPFQFENKSYEEILQTLETIQPPRPSDAAKNVAEIDDRETEKNRRVLRGDLDNIVLMCLRREPERRYKSVESLSDDIYRFLKNLPVAARPNTFQYRAAKFVKRNKIPVSAVALTIFLVVSGLTVTLWQANVARRERDRAEQRFLQVRQLSNALLNDIAPKIERLEGSTEARQSLVEQSLKYLDSLAVESTDADLQAELAAAYEKIADLQGNPNRPNLSDFTGAIANYEKARFIRLNLPATFENRRLLAENFRAASNARFAKPDTSGALNDSIESLKIFETLLSENSGAIDLKKERIETQIEQAQIYAYNNQYSEAVPLFRRAVAELVELDVNERETRRLSIKGSAYLANALSWDGKQGEAETIINQTINDADALAAEFPNDAEIQQTAWRVYSLASSIYENFNDQTARSLAAKALQFANKAAAADPTNTQAKHNLARSFSRLGGISIKLKQLSEGVPYLQQSEKILSDLVVKEPNNLAYQRDLATLYARLGDARLEQKNLPDGLRNFQKSVETLDAYSRADEKSTVAERDIAQSLKSIGYIYLQMNEKEKAFENFQKSSEILDRLKSRNALGKFDEKLISEVRNGILRSEKSSDEK